MGGRPGKVGGSGHIKVLQPKDLLSMAFPASLDGIKEPA